LPAIRLFNARQKAAAANAALEFSFSSISKDAATLRFEKSLIQEKYANQKSATKHQKSTPKQKIQMITCENDLLQDCRSGPLFLTNLYLNPTRFNFS
jgi:hypothetical protein